MPRGVMPLAAVLLVAFGPALVDTPAVRGDPAPPSAAVDGEVAGVAQDRALPGAAWRAAQAAPRDSGNAERDGGGGAGRSAPLAAAARKRRSFLHGGATAEPPSRGGAAAKEEPLDAIGAYRKVANALAQSLQRFAPDTALRIENAALDDFRNVNFSARTGAQGVDLEATGESRWWKRLAAKGRMEYADLATRAQIDVEGLVVDSDVPAAELRAQRMRSKTRSS